MTKLMRKPVRPIWVVLAITAVLVTSLAAIRARNLDSTSAFGTWTMAGTVDAGTGTFILPQGTGTAPTGEGRVFWQTANDDLTIGDAAAAQQVVFRAGTETIDGNKTLSGTTTISGTATITGTLNNSGGAWLVPAANSPAQTTDASLVWDADDDRLTVGNGTAREVFHPWSVATVTAATTLTAAQSGRVVIIDTAASGVVITLPATAAGLHYWVVIRQTHNAHAVSPNAVDLIRATGITALDDKDLINSTGTVGASIHLIGDGVDGWYAQVTGTWTREA